MLQDVGVSWEWTDDANRQPMALDHEELAEVIITWPLLSGPHTLDQNTTSDLG